MSATRLDQAISKAADQEKSFSFFNKVPKTILEHNLLPCLDLTSDRQTLQALTLVSKEPSVLFQNQLSIKQFLHTIIHGDINEVEKILKKSTPSSRLKLLTTPDIVTYSEQTIYGTALQLALGAEDVKMAKMIMKYMDELPDGNLLKQNQIREQFPEGWETKESEQKTNDSAALQKLFNVIHFSNDENDWEIALEQFKAYIKPKTVIKNGKHFNNNVLREALFLYDRTYGFTDYVWGNPRPNFYVKKVLNELLKYHLPACYLRYCYDRILNCGGHRTDLSICDLRPKTLMTALYFSSPGYHDIPLVHAEVPEKKPRRRVVYVKHDDLNRVLHSNWIYGETLLTSYTEEAQQRSTEISNIIHAAYHQEAQKSRCILL